MGDEQRHRVVLLGAGAVGKSSILSRFLHGKFDKLHRATVDDLHCRDYNVDGTCMMVDFLDTAGDHSFPAMRRLSISTAHAFILVYALDNVQSLAEVKQLWEQICECRDHPHDMPVVVVGNKCDAERLIDEDDVSAWAEQASLPQSALLECSAKQDNGVVAIFERLLKQANMPRVKQLEPILSRRLSAKEGRTRREDKDGIGSGGGAKMSRSRSLIRRTTRPKLKQASRLNTNDCVIS